MLRKVSFAHQKSAGSGTSDNRRPGTPRALFNCRPLGYVGRVILNALTFLSRRPPPEHGRGFVEEVRASRYAPRRNRRVEWVILGCWLAIAAKYALIVWLVERYRMAFDPLWINAPTVVFGLICTAVYFFRE